MVSINMRLIAIAIVFFWPVKLSASSEASLIRGPGAELLARLVDKHRSNPKNQGIALEVFQAHAWDPVRERLEDLEQKHGMIGRLDAFESFYREMNQLLTMPRQLNKDSFLNFYVYAIALLDPNLTAQDMKDFGSINDFSLPEREFFESFDSRRKLFTSDANGPEVFIPINTKNGLFGLYEIIACWIYGWVPIPLMLNDIAMEDQPHLHLDIASPVQLADHDLVHAFSLLYFANESDLPFLGEFFDWILEQENPKKNGLIYTLFIYLHESHLQVKKINSFVSRLEEYHLSSIPSVKELTAEFMNIYFEMPFDTFFAIKVDKIDFYWIQKRLGVLGSFEDKGVPDFDRAKLRQYCLATKGQGDLEPMKEEEVLKKINPTIEVQRKVEAGLCAEFVHDYLKFVSEKVGFMDASSAS